MATFDLNCHDEDILSATTRLTLIIKCLSELLKSKSLPSRLSYMSHLTHSLPSRLSCTLYSTQSIKVLGLRLPFCSIHCIKGQAYDPKEYIAFLTRMAIF